MSMQAWKYSTAAGRWAGFGPYYAMFPVHFARTVVEQMCPIGGRVLDPFCGRGTAPFVAQATGRHGYGIDNNPAAWVFSTAKTAPEKNESVLLNRISDVCRAVRPKDKRAENEFQRWAWSPDVLGFLNAARRMLDWQTSTTDRTLMGFLMVNVHAKLGEGMSNQMHKARALGPDYSVRWWKKHKMSPPEISPQEFLRHRIDWRYRHGVVNSSRRAKIILGAAEDELSRQPKLCRAGFDLLFTSPPYLGVTKYRQDSWIRLWLLNEGPALPDWRKDPNTGNVAEYAPMLNAVFASAAKLLKPRGVVWVRTDARKVTQSATESALRKSWHGRKLFVRSAPVACRTQTWQFGNCTPKPGEIDFLIPGNRQPPEGFVLRS